MSTPVSAIGIRKYRTSGRHSQRLLYYRDQVRGALLDSTDALGYCPSTDLLAQGGRVFELILEHEYMHQETLLYMMQQMTPDAKLRPRNFPRYSFGRAAARETVRIPAGKARLGARFDDLTFGWDNEFAEITVDVAGFTMDSFAGDQRRIP